MTPMQKIEEAWKILCETGKDTMLYKIKVKESKGRYIRIPYTTTITSYEKIPSCSVPVIRVMDFSIPPPTYSNSLTGWYTLEEFKAMIEKYGFELMEEV